MLSYKAPLRDVKFLINEVFDYQNHYQNLYKNADNMDSQTIDMILQSIASFSENTLLPLYQSGDDEGCALQDGVVSTPKGFKEAYQQFVEGGWAGLCYPSQFGGMELPASISLIKSELIGSANWAWAMYCGLTTGGIHTLLQHGTDAQKAIYLPKMVTGQWTGTMCLTEADAGTDLGQLTMRALPQDDGSYKLSGIKIFISAGEHDLSENIVHIVLARLPNAPQGTRGISLFIVPKFLPNQEGEIGERNAVICSAIEDKMGIHASSTCVLNFDGATGFLIGTPNKGLKAMFTYMNTARIGTAVQGVAHSELAFQNALAYAKERHSMRALSGTKEPNKNADAIIHHADVRRMLLTQKVFSEGGRSMIYHAARYADNLLQATLDNNQEEIDKWENKLSFYTPILKGFLTECGIESAKLGQQIFGGYGYIKEYGMEQIARDARIATLYEGTTGVQALDLLGRKVLLQNGGKAVRDYTAGIMKWCGEYVLDKDMRKFVWALTKLCAEYNTLTLLLAVNAKRKSREIISAASEDYLMYSGYVMMAYHWARMAAVAFDKLKNGGQEEAAFYTAKIQSATFYFDKILPRCAGLSETMTAPSESMTDMDIEYFAFLD